MEPMEVVPTVVTVVLAGLLLAGSLVNLSLVGRDAVARPANVARRATLPLATALAVAALVLGAGPAISVPASLAALLALEAWAIRFATPATLAELAESRGAAGDPAWWPDFERDFRTYLSRPEQNPLRTATERRS